jgi:uncharacterized damage-inducible protein DinB
VNGAPLGHAFDHHVWATVTMIDACRALPPEQLGTSAAGTYGSIRDTIRHLVESDAIYLSAFEGGVGSGLGADVMDLDEWRAEMERHGDRWRAVLARDHDPEAIVVRRRSNGSESHAPAGIRFAQALVHGADHRSHLATILTTLGVEPRRRRLGLRPVARPRDRGRSARRRVGRDPSRTNGGGHVRVPRRDDRSPAPHAGRPPRPAWRCARGVGRHARHGRRLAAA